MQDWFAFSIQNASKSVPRKKMTSSCPFFKHPLKIGSRHLVLNSRSCSTVRRRSGAALAIWLGLGMVSLFCSPTRMTRLRLSSVFLWLLYGTYTYRIAINYPDNLPRPISSRWYAITALFCSSSALSSEHVHLDSRSFTSSPTQCRRLTPGDQVVVKKWGYIARNTVGYRRDKESRFIAAISSLSNSTRSSTHLLTTSHRTPGI